MGKNKLISAGELGVAVTNSKELYDELLFIGHPNRVPDALLTDKYRNYINGIGNKYRPHPLSMVLAIEQIKRYEIKKQLNIKTNQYISQEIDKIDGFEKIGCYEKASRVYWKNLIRINKNYWKNIETTKVVQALQFEGITLEQFHNYNIEENEKIWQHERYRGRVNNKSTLNSPDNILIMPGYIKIKEEEKKKIIECFKKVSKYKEELK